VRIKHREVVREPVAVIRAFGELETEPALAMRRFRHPVTDDDYDKIGSRKRHPGPELR
jgi:hypothetical protein